MIRMMILMLMIKKLVDDGWKTSLESAKDPQNTQTLLHNHSVVIALFLLLASSALRDASRTPCRMKGEQRERKEKKEMKRNKLKLHEKGVQDET